MPYEIEIRILKREDNYSTVRDSLLLESGLGRHPWEFDSLEEAQLMVRYLELQAKAGHPLQAPPAVE